MIFHLADFIPLNERDVLTLFSLPTFVMISGCLFNVKSGMLEFVKRKVKTLLVPFAFFYTITCVCAVHSFVMFWRETGNLFV